MPALARDEVQHHVPRDPEQPVAKRPFAGLGIPAVHGGSDRAEDFLDEIRGVGVLKPLPARQSVNQGRVNRRELGPGALVLGVAQADQQARSSVRHLVHSIPFFTELSSINTTQGRKPHKDFPWRLNRLR